MKTHRRAPYTEWVEMYRRGLTASQIAKVVRAPATTIRYHLRLARTAEPGLGEEHQASLQPARKVGKAGRANLAAIVAFFEAEGRFPSSKAAAPKERALAAWLARRRQDKDAGTLAPEYREGLRAVPNWEVSRRKRKNAAQ
ncbi:hypothetical protein [Pseudarthrobacter sp. NamE5]|uniref:hypothetical protein n=1 Tax=Pseudarthrobacter sp. NamE5 TaxID=2576839 RepID=UPI0011713236|nr:hypothetical protein [Pseudarthrobacter sp. NamE5]TLM87190.1 hypothetical protein FDW84_05175 [Pseudarthrobacter sp. NamE5]